MIGRVILDAFKFGFSLRRMLPFIFLNLLLFYTICDVLGRIGPMEVTEESISSMAPLFGLYLFIFFIYAISQPLLVAAMFHQAKNFGKKVSIKKSFQFSFSVFLKSFFIFLIFFAVYSLIGTIPFIWPILFLIFGLASFYVYPAAMMDGKKIIESFKKSFSIFKKAPLQTFVVSLIMGLVTFVLVLISFTPFLFWIGGNLYVLYQQNKETSILAEYLAKLLLSPTIIPFLLIPAFVISFCVVTNIGAQSRLYVLLKKRG
jgi:hypothetical protein